MIKLDGFAMMNSNTSPGSVVKVRKCKPSRAEKVVLAPNIPAGKKVSFKRNNAEVAEMFKKKLLNRVIVEGNEIILDDFKFSDDHVRFMAVNVKPPGAVTVDMGTEVEVLEDSCRDK